MEMTPTSTVTLDLKTSGAFHTSLRCAPNSYSAGSAKPKQQRSEVVVVSCWLIRTDISTMSEHKGYSPSFKRPAEILRMRRQRARSDAGISSGCAGGESGSSPLCVRSFSPGPLFTAHSHSGVGHKRRNPFANIENTHSPKKKLLIFNDASGNTGIVESSGTMKPVIDEGDENSPRREHQGGRALGFKLVEAEEHEHRKVPTQVGRCR